VSQVRTGFPFAVGATSLAGSTFFTDLRLLIAVKREGEELLKGKPMDKAILRGEELTVQRVLTQLDDVFQWE
jgi:hypothetical protein